MQWLRDYRHRRHRRLLSEHLDGRLAGVALKRLEQHLAACATCREALLSLRATVQALHTLPPAPVPRSFVLTERPAPRPSPRPVLLRSLQLSSAVAAVLLATLVIGDFAGLFPTAPTATTALRTDTSVPAPSGPEGQRGPAAPANAAAVTTPTLAPRASSTPTPAPGADLSNAVSGTPEVAVTFGDKGTPAPTDEATEQPRSTTATALLALKLALGTAVAVMAIATGYLAWRRRRRQA